MTSEGVCVHVSVCGGVPRPLHETPVVLSLLQAGMVVPLPASHLGRRENRPPPRRSGVAAQDPEPPWALTLPFLVRPACVSRPSPPPSLPPSPPPSFSYLIFLAPFVYLIIFSPILNRHSGQFHLHRLLHLVFSHVLSLHLHHQSSSSSIITTICDHFHHHHLFFRSPSPSSLPPPLLPSPLP